MNQFIHVVSHPITIILLGSTLALIVGRMLWSLWWRSIPIKPDDDKSVDTYPWLYFVGLLITVGLWAILGFYLHEAGFQISLGKYTLDFGYLMGVFAILHLLWDVRKVPLSEVAGIFFIGLPTIQVSGIWLPVPPLLFSITSFPKLVIEVEIPGDPEKIWREDGPVPANLAAEGWRPPFRVPFADTPDRATASPELQTLMDGIRPTDPLHRRSTNEVSWFARFQIDRVFDFIANTGSAESVIRQIDDMGSSLINDELTKMTPAMALQGLGYVSTKLERVIRDHTRHWGVGLRTIRIKQIEMSHHLNSSIQSIPQAIAEGQATVQTAMANKEKARLAGEGERAAYDARKIGTGLTDEQLLNAQTGVDIATALANGTGTNEKVILGASGAISDVLGVISAASGKKP